jgi:CubicO group peptidase (beta-lactamase class C family)
VPAAGGITNARGLAALYAPLAGSGDNRLVSEEAIARMGAVSSATGRDASLLLPTRFALGFMKGVDNRAVASEGDSIILSEEAFGHSGVGGSIGFADPKRRMSFGYTMNALGAGVGINARGQSLVDAAYRSLGARGDNAGSWV